MNALPLAHPPALQGEGDRSLAPALFSSKLFSFAERGSLAMTAQSSLGP